jgi:hypothetical protein
VLCLAATCSRLKEECIVDRISSDEVCRRKGLEKIQPQTYLLLTDESNYH